MSGLLFQRPKYTDKATRQFSFKGVYVINILLSFRNELGREKKTAGNYLPFISGS
jgi:hypothetical protein